MKGHVTKEAVLRIPLDRHLVLNRRTTNFTVDILYVFVKDNDRPILKTSEENITMTFIVYSITEHQNVSYRQNESSRRVLNLAESTILNIG